jgi:hypothetical protein
MTIEVSGHRLVESDGLWHKQFYVSVSCDKCGMHIDTPLMSIEEHKVLLKAYNGKILCKKHKTGPLYYANEVDYMKDNAAIQSERLHTAERQIKILQIKIGMKNEEIEKLKPYSEVVPQ